MRWEFNPGDRVEFMASAGMPAFELRGRQHATVVRANTRGGRRRYLIRFDQSDEFYGLYWVAAECLRALDNAAA